MAKGDQVRDAWAERKWLAVRAKRYRGFVQGHRTVRWGTLKAEMGEEMDRRVGDVVVDSVNKLGMTSNVEGAYYSRLLRVRQLQKLAATR